MLYVFNKLCVVGGWSKDDPSCPVEQFCPQYNEWKMTAPMLHHRSDPGVCTLGGAIYTVGGSDDVTCLSSVERWPFTSTSVIQIVFFVKCMKDLTIDFSRVKIILIAFFKKETCSAALVFGQ